MHEPRPEDDGRRAATKQRLERQVHWTLLAGVALSGLLLLAGLLATMARGPARSHAGLPPSPRAAFRGASHDEPATVLLDLGLLTLMATPVVRVAVLAIGWALARDWRFAAVALIVLALLGLSLGLGLG